MFHHLTYSFNNKMKLSRNFTIIFVGRNYPLTYYALLSYNLWPVYTFSSTNKQKNTTLINKTRRPFRSVRVPNSHISNPGTDLPGTQRKRASGQLIKVVRTTSAQGRARNTLWEALDLRDPTLRRPRPYPISLTWKGSLSATRRFDCADY